MDVGGVVPLEGQVFGDGSPAFEGQVDAASPVREIGEADDDFFANPQEFCEDLFGVSDCLEGLGEDDVVEGFVGVVGEPVFDVVLDYGESSLYAGEHQVLLYFNSDGLYALIAAETGEEFSVAAAGVEDSAVRFDERFYEGVIDSDASAVMRLASLAAPETFCALVLIAGLGSVSGLEEAA